MPRAGSSIDGEVAILGARADPATARIEVDGVPVVVDTTCVYWLLNKPAGYVTTSSDPQGRPTVVELVPSEPRAFAVGRLDLETEGLLVLTNDGELAELLMHPSHGVEKTYLAEVDGVPSPGALRALRQGVQLDDGPARAIRAQVVQKSNDGGSALGDRAEGRPQAHRAQNVLGDRPPRAPARPHPHRIAQRSEASARRAPSAHTGRDSGALRERARQPHTTPRLTSDPVKVLALRGATTIDENTKAEVDAKTQRLVAEMLERNAIDHDDLVSIIFTATDDITAEFPATAAAGARARGRAPDLRP